MGIYKSYEVKRLKLICVHLDGNSTEDRSLRVCDPAETAVNGNSDGCLEYCLRMDILSAAYHLRLLHPENMELRDGFIIPDKLVLVYQKEVLNEARQ